MYLIAQYANTQLMSVTIDDALQLINETAFKPCLRALFYYPMIDTEERRGKFAKWFRETCSPSHEEEFARLKARLARRYH